MNSVAGRPLRVSITRWCADWPRSTISEMWINISDSEIVSLFANVLVVSDSTIKTRRPPRIPDGFWWPRCLVRPGLGDLWPYSPERPTERLVTIQDAPRRGYVSSTSSQPGSTSSNRVTHQLGIHQDRANDGITRRRRICTANAGLSWAAGYPNHIGSAARHGWDGRLGRGPGGERNCGGCRLCLVVLDQRPREPVRHERSGDHPS